jgi:hypothetical protein
VAAGVARPVLVVAVDAPAAVARTGGSLAEARERIAEARRQGKHIYCCQPIPSTCS